MNQQLPRIPRQFILTKIWNGLQAKKMTKSKITESEIEQFAIAPPTRLRDTLLSKLMSREVRVQLAQRETAI